MGGGEREGGEESLAKKGVLGRRAVWNKGTGPCNALRDLRCEGGETALNAHTSSVWRYHLEHKLPDSKASVLLFAPQLCKITEKINGY